MVEGRKAAHRDRSLKAAHTQAEQNSIRWGFAREGREDDGGGRDNKLSKAP